MLLDSPWAQPASATFGPELTPADMPPAPLPGAADAGVAGPRPNSGAGWDGGPGKNPRGQPPKLPVTIRWDSALPVRQALLQLPASDREGNDLYTPAEMEKDYIITVTGLVPAAKYRSAGQLETEARSSSEDNGSRADLQDPEPLLESLMGSSRLLAPNRPPIRPEDAKLNAATGTFHLFFPRREAMSGRDKEVTFTTRFGSVRLERKFRLKEMMYQGRLEL